MIRVKVNLTEEQRSVVERLAARNGVSMSEVVRRAIDQWIAERGTSDGEGSDTVAGSAGDQRAE